MPPRILLCNHWHDDNRGDSAITQGIVTLLNRRYGESEITVTTLWEEGELSAGGSRHLTAAFPEITVRPSPVPTELRGSARDRGKLRTGADAIVWWLRRAPGALDTARGHSTRAWQPLMRSHDLVVLVGGSNIFDDAGVPALLGVPRLSQVLSPVAAAHAGGVPVVMLGHTLGPFHRAAARRLIDSASRRTTSVVVRDARSERTARAAGATFVEEAPDLAFGLEPRQTAEVESMLARLPAAPHRTIGLSIRRHPTLGRAADDRVVSVFAEAARGLVSSGVVDAVAVVPHTTGPTPVEDDRPISRRLLAAVSDLPSILLAEDIGPDELSAFYGSLAAVVGVRLHAGILALNGGAPTFAVAYLTGKTHGVMKQVGLPDAVGEFATVTATDIVDGVRALVSAPGLRQRLARDAVTRREALVAGSMRWLPDLPESRTSAKMGPAVAQTRS